MSGKRTLDVRKAYDDMAVTRLGDTSVVTEKFAPESARHCPPARSRQSISAVASSSNITTIPARPRTPAIPKTGGCSILGDMGYVDEDGVLDLTDRKTFIIMSGDVNSHLQEAENLLANHRGRLKSRLFGIPNEAFGEAVKAAVHPAT